MNKVERIKMVKAMEYIARHVNDEADFFVWLMNGVADGDIEHGDLTVNENDEENLDYYIGDEELSELMRDFLKQMTLAKIDGGLYCDGVVSKNIG